MINHKEKLKLFLARAKLYIIRRPILKRVAVSLLTPFPTFERRLKRATEAAFPVQLAQPRIANELVPLTPRARRIYADLKMAIENRCKERSK
jgi:hypothetical protein